MYCDFCAEWQQLLGLFALNWPLNMIAENSTVRIIIFAVFFFAENSTVRVIELLGNVK